MYCFVMIMLYLLCFKGWQTVISRLSNRESERNKEYSMIRNKE